MNEIKDTSSTLTKISKQPSVDLIITGKDGAVLSTMHFGINPHLAGWLSHCSQQDDKDRPVDRNTESLMVLAQDTFVVTREILMMIRGMAYPARSMVEIRELEKNMPGTAIYTFVVSH